ncbi:MAG: hypothetical protein P8Q39_03765, partial [Candidatus Thalassarchaeaceae archaeon]|nr:hypothetical protein [Candidatus Thalassarchaeaceae archaeon]
MALTHNQWAVVAITVTLCLAGTYSIAGSIMSTAIDYEDGASDILDDDTVFNEDMDDFDEDGLSDRLERNTYGTDPYDEDTDG